MSVLTIIINTHPHSHRPRSPGNGGAGEDLAKSPVATGKHQQSFFPARKAANAGKPAAGIAAIEAALNHFLNNRAEEAVLLLETALIFS